MELQLLVVGGELFSSEEVVALICVVYLVTVVVFCNDVAEASMGTS